MVAPARTKADELPYRPGAGGDLVVDPSHPDDVYRMWRVGDAFPRIVLDIQNGAILTGNGTIAPTPITTAPFFGTPGPTQYIDYANGSDTNDGFSWTTARKTIAAGLAWVTNFGDGLFEGDIWLAANVAHVVTAELDFTQGVSWHGTSHPNMFGNGSAGFNGGTQIVWGGPDSGYVFKSNNFNISGGSYAATGVVENFSVYIPPSYNVVKGFGFPNAQNMSRFSNLGVIGGKTTGFDFWSDDGAGGASANGTPGYISLDRCWVYRGGTRPFYFNGGLENILMTHCAVDANTLTLAGVTVGNTPVADHGTGLSLTMISCKFESQGATAGGAGDCPFVEVQSGSMDCDLTVLGGFEQSNITTFTSACILYSATPTQVDDGVTGVPVHIHGMMSQSRSILLSAPNAIGGAITVRTESANTGGTRTRWSWDRAFRSGDSFAAVTASGTVKMRTTVANATGGAIVMTLPTSVGLVGVRRTLKKTDASANAVTLACTGGQTIDGAATKVLAAQNAFVTVISDNANWLIVG